MSDVLSRVPFHERGIPYEVAKPWLKVSSGFLQLEGLCFDPQGDLYFCDVFKGGIHRVRKGSTQVETLLTLRDAYPAAVKLGPDGRLYIGCLGDFERTGSLVAFDVASGKVETIIGPERGYVIDDLCFRKDGSFYFSNFIGGATERTGGIFLSSPEGKSIVPVCQNMGIPNGLALTPDQRGLWVTEMGAGTLHFLELEPDGVIISHYGDLTPYHFTGLNGPDSCCVDRDGNLYVAMYMQGRVLVFSPAGFPVKQIIIPEAAQGHMLRSTHPRIAPGTRDLYICTNDGPEGEGAAIYRAEALAEAL